MTPLNEESMRAAEAILKQGFCIQVVYLKPSTGVIVDCLLSGRGDEEGTALLVVWIGEQMHHKAVPFERVLLPAHTCGQLGLIAKTQRRQAVIDAAKAMREQQLAGASL